MPGIALYDKRMLEVMAYMKSERGIVNRDFLISIGFDHRNLGKVVAGEMSFKLYQVYNCIKDYRVNPGFFFIKAEVMF